MLTSAIPRRIAGIIGALILSALVLAPYDFAAATRTLVSVAQGGSANVALVLRADAGFSR